MKQKHIAPQVPMPLGEPCQIIVRLNIDAAHRNLWDAYLAAHGEFKPTPAQCAAALVSKGLEAWGQQKGVL